MDTKELIEEVRYGLIEFQKHVVSDEVILVNLNHAKRQIYNHYSRADDNMFGRIVELPIVTNVNTYELPKTLWSKRVDYLQVPIPNDTARSYVKVDKFDAKQNHNVNLPSAYSPVPWAWQQLGNTIEIYPRPTASITARLIVQPKLVPFRKTEGRLLSLVMPTITCIDNLSSDFAAYAGLTNGENYLSICDGLTGELKHIFRFTAVTGSQITLADPSVLRNQSNGVAFSDTTTDVSNVGIDDVICYKYGTGVSILGEAFNEYLVKYAIITIKGNLNESDPTTQDQLKELRKEYLSDRVGRPGITTIERLDRTRSLSSVYRRRR